MVLASIFLRLPPCKTIQPIDRHNFNGEAKSFGVPEIFWHWSLRHHQFFGNVVNPIIPIIKHPNNPNNKPKKPKNQDFSGWFFAIPCFRWRPMQPPRQVWANWRSCPWAVGMDMNPWCLTPWRSGYGLVARNSTVMFRTLYSTIRGSCFYGNVRLFIVPLKNGNWVRLIGILIRTYSIHSMVGAVRVSWLISLMLEAAICRLCSGATEACGEVGGGWADSKGC